MTINCLASNFCHRCGHLFLPNDKLIVINSAKIGMLIHAYCKLPDENYSTKTIILGNDWEGHMLPPQWPVYIGTNRLDVCALALRGENSVIRTDIKNYYPNFWTKQEIMEFPIQIQLYFNSDFTKVEPIQDEEHLVPIREYRAIDLMCPRGLDTMPTYLKPVFKELL